MADDRTLANASGTVGDFHFKIAGPALKRLKHALWAGVIALALFGISFLDPVDQLLWLNQSRIPVHKPSGEFVFVVVDQKADDPNFGNQRADIARAIRELDKRGVGKVFLDLTFDRASDPASDKALADAIASLGPRAILVDREVATTSGPRLAKTIPQIAGKAMVVAEGDDTNWLGFVWTMPYSRTYEGKRYASLGGALGGQTLPIKGRFQVNYSVSVREIVTVDINQISESKATPHALRDIAGKSIVIGKGEAETATNSAIPGYRSVASSYVAIMAAETLRSGRTVFVPGILLLFAIAAGLIGVILATRNGGRRFLGYGIAVATVPLLVSLSVWLGVRIEASYAIAYLIIYALFRSWARWKDRVAKIDLDTGLPTLRALEERISLDDGLEGHVVVAKIHGYEHVLKTLKAEDRTLYILKLADRLRAADKELTVYFDGHYLGWHTSGMDSEALVEHLEGLRAIFAAPIMAGAHMVDVGITFGIARLEGDRHHRIPAAIAAAEETSEANEPIKLAESGSQVDLLWDLSLRARIDEAMSAGEIYCVYQPKVDIRTGAMTGVEALVRWHDPSRGFISPMHFIRQCEKAGRMEHLTRYVLQSACTAGQLLHFRGRPITMSVNISATLLGDMRIVGIVRNVLQATNFAPGFLTLEVTETTRISDLTVAATILNELKALGAHISIDDFGVGAANFETLFELPFDELKIDRLFIANMISNPKARAIASSIVAMGREARITIVAEGVESSEELEILNEIGCTQVQGYAISRPISLSNLLEFKDMPLEHQNRHMV